MKPGDNIKLDDHIRDMLKAPDAPVPQVDWSEVEVLLRHESKSISLPSVSLPDKKYLLAGAGAIALIAIIIFLANRAGPATEDSQTPEGSDTAISLVPAADAVAPTPSVAPAPPQAASLAEDTSLNAPAKPLQDELRIADSLLGIEDAPAPAAPAPAAPKKEKKSRLSGLAPSLNDPGQEPENILPADTAQSRPVEIKIEAPVHPGDSAKASPSRKGKKGKKSKAADGPSTRDSLK